MALSSWSSLIMTCCILHCARFITPHLCLNGQNKALTKQEWLNVCCEAEKNCTPAPSCKKGLTFYQRYIKHLAQLFCQSFNENYLFIATEDRRSMTSFYYCSVNHQSGLQSNTFSKLSYIFLIHQNVPQIMSFHLRYMMVS